MEYLYLDETYTEEVFLGRRSEKDFPSGKRVEEGKVSEKNFPSPDHWSLLFGSQGEMILFSGPYFAHFVIISQGQAGYVFF